MIDHNLAPWDRLVSKPSAVQLVVNQVLALEIHEGSGDRFVLASWCAGTRNAQSRSIGLFFAPEIESSHFCKFSM